MTFCLDSAPGKVAARRRPGSERRLGAPSLRFDPGTTSRFRGPKSAPLSEAPVSEDPLPDEIASRNRLKKPMPEVAQTLPLAQNQAIILCLGDFSFEEIGEAMGISAHVAQMRCHRARAALKAATAALP